VRVKVEVDCSDVLRRLDRADDALADLSPALMKAGFWLLLTFWERVVRRPIQAYSARYLRWLLANGEISGKLVGILTGDLIGQMQPVADGAGGGDFGLELDPDGTAVEVGHINPASEAKARGFDRWHRSKFGESYVEVRPEDEEGVREVLAEALVDLGFGGE